MGALWKSIGLSLGGSVVGAGFNYMKMLGVIVVLAILGGIGFGIYEFVKTFNELQQTVAVQKQQIESLTTLLTEEREKREKLEASGKVNNGAIAGNLLDQSKTDKTVYTNTKKRDDEIADIKDKYKPLPPTVDNKEKERIEISTVNINSLWDTYCGLNHISEGNTNCVKTENVVPIPVIPIEQTKPLKEVENV